MSPSPETYKRYKPAIDNKHAKANVLIRPILSEINPAEIRPNTSRIQVRSATLSNLSG